MIDSKPNKVPVKISRDLHAALKERQFENFRRGDKTDMSDMADAAVSAFLRGTKPADPDEPLSEALQHPGIGPIIRQLVAYVAANKRNTKKRS